MRMRLRTAFARAACLGLALVAGCTSTTAKPPDGSRLVIAVVHEPSSLNPLTMTGPATATLVPLIYSELLTIDAAGHLRGDVATTVPTLANGGVSKNGLTITYHLRRDVKWQDGLPLTARDVAFTFSAIMSPHNNVVSRVGYEEVQRIDEVDDWTVRIRLRRRYAPILSEFFAPNQNYAILPAHLLAGQADLNDSPFNAAPIGSGPYRVVSWKRGEDLRLERNASYVGGTPGFGSLLVKFVPDSNTILNQLRSGEADMTLAGDPALLAEYDDVARTRVVRASIAAGGDLFFNTADPLLHDPRVRRALVEAVDFRKLVHIATRGAEDYADAARGLFSWGYDPAVLPPAYDPKAAARLFDAAGFTRSGTAVRTRGGTPLALQLAFETGNAVASSVGVALQQELATAGVQLTLHAYAPSQMRAPAAQGGPLYGGTFQLGFLEIFTAVDPDVGWLLSCSQVPPHGFNFMRYCDPVAEDALRLGVATFDPAQRTRLASTVQRRVFDQLPLLPLWQTKSVDVVPTTLEGFMPSGTSPAWNAGSWRE
jgi:peptide/nickel transport system substrate-binding protein